MIANTPLNTLLIRLSILSFRAITPLCTILSLSSLAALLTPSHLLPSALRSSRKAFPIAVFLLTVPEPLFYALVYLPKLRRLQHSTPPEGTALSRAQRGELARRFFAEVPDMPFFVGMWCRCADAGARNGKGLGKGMPTKRQVREWLAWGVLNRYSLAMVEEDGDLEELDEYLALVEEGLAGTGMKLLDDDDDAGERSVARGSRAPIRVTIDPIRVLHRPLLFYVFGVGMIDLLLFVKMWRMGFHHYPVSRNFLSFPWRPISTFPRHRSPAMGMSYWYRPHTSRTRLPILYIHGIGVGLITYMDFFAEIIAKDTGDPDDQVGILALEVMPISFRLSAPIPPCEELVAQISQILSHHGWNNLKFVLAANSYGTIIATYLLRSSLVAPCIGPLVLIDPVTLWAHMGDVAYNFTVKHPRSASEWQLYYFACTDIMAAHTVTRRFQWRENVLWRDEVQGKKVGIVLSGSDIILDAGRLRKFLVGDLNGVGIDGVDGAERIKTHGQSRTAGWEILWFEGLNHAEVFERNAERAVLVEMVWNYCKP